MKKNSLIISALAIIGIAACTAIKEEIIGKEEITVFYASIETPTETEDTKVYADNTLHVLWNADDRISIFNKYTVNQEYQFTGEDGDKSGSFKKVPNDDFVTGSELSYVYAVYPHAESSKISNDGVLTLTLPAEQAYKDASFGLGANTMVSVTANNNLQFKNAGGYISFKLYGDNVKVSSISLKGNNGEKLAGKATVTMASGGTPSVAMLGAATETVTLTCANPVTLGTSKETASDFWLVLPPTTLSNGFTVTLTDPDGKTFTKSTSASLTIRRNGLTRMSALEVTIEPPVPSSENISFADPIAKYACVEKFDTNGDGEVSYEEAAAATTLSGLFADWNTVTSFEEIRYFTSVTSTLNIFNGLTKLTHITIPDNITTLGSFQGCTALETVVLPAPLNALPTYCFDGCSSLKSVTLPTGITSIPNYAFRNCAVLETLSVPSTIKSVGQYAFSNCTVLTGIDLPSGFQTIGNYAFQNCQAIASVDFPTSLTSIGQYAYSGCTALTSATVGNGVSIGQYAFSGCSSLVSVVLPEDMTTIPAYCFQNCTGLTTISWPSALTTIGDNAFAGCLFKDSDFALQLPSSVTTIGSNAFGALHHLILPSSTPISITSNSFMVDYTVLYVPAGMVEMYKVRTNWSNYADRIRPISDYPVPHPSVSGTVGEPIDLGLSVKWASWNVGASAPEDYGAYFAWGETEIDWDYDWASYKWCMGYENTMTKYCHDSSYGYNGFTDTKTFLDPEDDAACANWGGIWRMPTDAEWTELRENCTWTWTTQNGVKGYRVTGKKTGYTDKSIFLPAAGDRYNTNLLNVGFLGDYWSSSLRTDYPGSAWDVYFLSDRVRRLSSGRYYGLSVRPVTE